MKKNIIILNIILVFIISFYFNANAQDQDALSAPQGTIEVTVDSVESDLIEKNVPLENAQPAAGSDTQESSGAGLKPLPVENTTPEVSPNDIKLESKTPNGQEVSHNAGNLPRPAAIMIENEPPARPQSGLYAAKILYEIQAEEITRFMGIYYDLDQNVEVGPIRSARHYFADLSTMYDGVYTHVGGSPQGLQEIKDRGINNINAIKGDRGFYRTNERRIPHNLYIKLPNLKKEIVRKKYNATTDAKLPFNFWDSKKTSEELAAAGIKGEKIKKIHIPYMKSYRVSYEFNEAENKYIRLYNDKPFKDYRNQTVVSADNVVVMRCYMHIIDEKMRHEMDLYEGGTCEIGIGGHFFVGSWDRTDKSGIIKYYDADKNEVKFNPGNIIVHVIPPKQAVIIDDTKTYAYGVEAVKHKKNKKKNGSD